jgi:hypothetical protein
MTDTQLSSTPSTLTSEETVLLIEGWLRTAPRLSFKQVRADARNLNLLVSPRQYGEAKRRLGITSAPPRPSSARNTGSRGRDMNQSVVAKTPLMSFLVEYLRNRPQADYGEVKSAGAAAGFQVAPINFGNARRMLGLSGGPVPGRAPRRRRISQSDESRAPAAPSTSRIAGKGAQRRRKARIDLGNLSNLVAELQEVIAERDRLSDALGKIAAIIRNV